MSGKNTILEMVDKMEKEIKFYKKDGDKVEFFDNAAKALGIIFMRFNNMEEMSGILGNINEYYKVVVE